jgi:hypothetical protein
MVGIATTGVSRCVDWTGRRAVGVDSPVLWLVVAARDAEHVAARPGGEQAGRSWSAGSLACERWSSTRSRNKRPRFTATSNSTGSTIGDCGGDWRTSRALSGSRPPPPLAQSSDDAGCASEFRGSALGRFGGSAAYARVKVETILRAVRAVELSVAGYVGRSARISRDGTGCSAAPPASRAKGSDAVEAAWRALG